VFHQAVYYGIFRVLYSLSVFFFAVFVAVLLWNCSCSAGVYGIWSCFDWPFSMLKMALKNLETSTVFMWYFIIRGRGRFRSTVGRSLWSRLHSSMRCRAVCSDSSGQVQCGVGTFFILWRYERKQPWFVSSCVRKWFGLLVLSLTLTRLEKGSQLVNEHDDSIKWNGCYALYSV